MSEQNRQEEAARNDRQRLEQQAVESRQLSERALAEERQRQEIRRIQCRPTACNVHYSVASRCKRPVLDKERTKYAHWFSDLFAMAGRKFFQQYANYKGYSDKGTDRADRSRHQR